MYTLREVLGQGDRRAFCELPRRLYREDPVWISPLDTDIEAVFDPKRNASFNGGEAVRWLLVDDQGEVVGRIGAFYNREQAAQSEQPTGGCGFFECIDDQQAANQLFDAARAWLLARGMEAMDGPINFGDRNQWWGLLVEGFSSPLYGNNYNPIYYKELFENYGFENYFNQYTYFRELVANQLSVSTYRRASRLFETPGYSFKPIDKRHLDQYAAHFMEVYNRAWVTFAEVKPIDIEHARKLLRVMKPILDPNLIYFAYYEEHPIGFFIMVPDLNRIIHRFRGKFGLWQQLQLLFRLRFTHEIDRALGLIFGVVPEFQGKGVESGLIRRFEQSVDGVNRHYKTLEMSWVGDFNPVMMRVVEQIVCARKYKIHTTYRYLFDREKPFERAPRLGRGKRTQSKMTVGSD